MANSQVLIDFPSVPIENQVLSFVEETLGINFVQTFKSIRSAALETEIPQFEPADEFHGDRYLGFISNYYEEALSADVNTSGQFTIAWSNGPIHSGIGSVLITANYPGAIFTMVSNTSPATLSITNESDPPVDPPESLDTVLPTTLNFQVLNQVLFVTPQNLIITTESSWSISNPLPSWLQVSQMNGTGNTTVVVTPINYSAMAVGTYTYNLNVFIGTQVFVRPITLIVSAALINPFSPGKLFFSLELDFLKFNSETLGTYIDFDIEIKMFKLNTYEEIIYSRTYKFPLFQGKGEFHVGSIVHDLFEEIQELSDFVPDLKTNYNRTQYRPAEVSVSFEEKTFGETVPGLISSTIPMFKMAKGHKPFMTENQLALLTVSQQEVTRITPQSFIATSFVYFGTPRIVVKKNNTIIEDFEIIPTPNKEIYSYFRFINNLKPGDSIELIVINELETRTQRFLVFKNGLESTYFWFENDNGVLEPFEFSGRRRIASPMKHITTTKLKNRHSYTSKVKSTITQNMIVNTGDLGKSDHRIITALVASPKVWCALDNPSGPYFRVDATTNKVDNQDTAINEENLNIEFNILEDANVSIYPR